MELYTFMPALRPSCMVEKKEALFPIEQRFRTVVISGNPGLSC